jgi:hypothetical protein
VTERGEGLLQVFFEGKTCMICANRNTHGQR